MPSTKSFFASGQKLRQSIKPGLKTDSSVFMATPFPPGAGRPLLDKSSPSEWPDSQPVKERQRSASLPNTKLTVVQPYRHSASARRSADWDARPHLTSPAAGKALGFCLSSMKKTKLCALRANVLLAFQMWRLVYLEKALLLAVIPVINKQD